MAYVKKLISCAAQMNCRIQCHNFPTQFAVKAEAKCKTYNYVGTRCIQSLYPTNFILRSGQYGTNYQIQKRSYLTKSKRKNAFEMDQKVPKDTLVFSFSNDKYYRTISFFGLVQFLFWLTFAYTSLGTLETLERAEDLFKKQGFWQKVLAFQTENKKKTASVCVLIG